MPIYEYECARCGMRMEKFVRRGKPEPRECPHCGGHLRRLFPTSIGIVFKGAGFYITDSRKQSQKKTNTNGEGKD